MSEPGGGPPGPVTRMSLAGVPDGRSVVPWVWWLPVVAIAVLATTTVFVVGQLRSTWVTLLVLAVSAVGYLAVTRRIRPAPLRAGQSTPASNLTLGRRMVAAAFVGLGLNGIWSVVVSLLIHPPVVRFTVSATALGGFLRGLWNAVGTSILEECGIALLILTAAAIAARSPARPPRRVAVIAVTSGVVVRTLLHIPLWGTGAIGRIGLSIALAWLFWRTRRIWPLIVAHIAWDTLAFQVLISPDLQIRAIAALAVVGWALVGGIVGVVAISRSRRPSMTRPAP